MKANSAAMGLLPTLADLMERNPEAEPGDLDVAFTAVNQPAFRECARYLGYTPDHGFVYRLRFPTRNDALEYLLRHNPSYWLYRDHQ